MQSPERPSPAGLVAILAAPTSAGEELSPAERGATMPLRGLLVGASMSREQEQLVLRGTMQFHAAGALHSVPAAAFGEDASRLEPGWTCGPAGIHGRFKNGTFVGIAWA